MRGMNLMDGNRHNKAKNRWQLHQQTQIENYVGRFNHNRVVAAFPGSMLFNHLLVEVKDNVSLAQPAPVQIPDSLDCVYEYCNSGRSAIDSLSHSAVIDTDGVHDISSIEMIVKNVVNDPAIRQVVFLGRSCRDKLIDHFSSRLKTVTYEPDWNSRLALHQIYREARRVIFVDNYRVMDAAFTHCSCTLIASERFENTLTADLLFRSLEQTPYCSVLRFSQYVESAANDSTSVDMQGSRELQHGPSKTSSYIACENNKVSLDQALKLAGNQAIEDDMQPDRLLQYIESLGSLAVINPEYPLNRVSLNFRDYKVGVLRKLNKLRSDPHAFCADSSYRLLNYVAKMLLCEQEYCQKQKEDKRNKVV